MFLIFILILESFFTMNLALAEDEALEKVIPIRIYIKKKEKKKKPVPIKREKWLEKYSVFAFYTLSEGTIVRRLKLQGLN